MYHGLPPWGDRKPPREVVTASTERITALVILGCRYLIVVEAACGEKSGPL